MSRWAKSPKDLGVPNLYQMTNGRFYYLFKVRGTKKKLSLDAKTKTLARQEGEKKQADHNAAMNGLLDGQGKPIKDPFGESKVDVQTVGWLYEQWEAADFPDPESLLPLNPVRRKKYKQVISKAVEYFKSTPVENLCQAEMDDFMVWRTKDATPQRPLTRACDTALDKLSVVIGWGIRRRILDVKTNPLIGRLKFTKQADVRHCTAVQPRSDEELHDIAGELMKGRRESQSLAFQALFEAYTGCRTIEIVSLRLDAQEGEPGFINWAINTLYINRAKSGVNPFVNLEQAEGNTALYDLIRAHRKWHEDTWGADYPWYFPNRAGNGHVHKDSLDQALKRVTKILQLPHRTSHGLRAFFVRTARSLGHSDTEIGQRLGHRSGARLVETTYGEIEPNWIGKKIQDWLPEDPAEVAYKDWMVSPLLSPLSNLKLPINSDIKGNAATG